MTNQPFNILAWLTLPVVIAPVVAERPFSLARSHPFNRPSLRYAEIVPGDAQTTWISFEPRSWSAATAQYVSGRIIAFDHFKLRSAAELHALKLYFLFATRRGNDTNVANISFDKINDYSSIERNRIKTAVSYLASIGLVYVEHLPSLANEHGIANAYRLAFLDSRVHMGTHGRGMDAFSFKPSLLDLSRHGRPDTPWASSRVSWFRPCGR